MSFNKNYRSIVFKDLSTKNAILFDGKYYMVVSGLTELANGNYDYECFEYNARSLEEAKAFLANLLLA